MKQSEWPGSLILARKGTGLSRQELASRAGISAESVRAYEVGRRKPSRATLVAILDALKLSRNHRDEMLMEAGYAPDGVSLGPDQYPDYMFTLEQAQEHLESMPWPAFVLDEVLEVVAANQLVQDLWGVDLRHEFTERFERNMMAVASNPRFTDHLLDWEELTASGISVFKGHHMGPEDLAAPSPVFNQLLAHFAAGDPQYVARFLNLWQKTPPRTPKVRWWYPVGWRYGDATMRFRGMVTTCNEPHGLAFNDWIPLDAESWTALEQLREDHGAGAG